MIFDNRIRARFHDEPDLGSWEHEPRSAWGQRCQTDGEEAMSRPTLIRAAFAAVPLCLLMTLAMPADAGAQTASLSEIRIDQPGADNDEYFELVGDPGALLTGLSYLVIGDGTGGSGVVEAVVDLSGQTIDASGFFVAAEASFSLGAADLTTSLNFENSDNVTHLLVRDFNGANGDDLDLDDDGVLDVIPWTALVDCAALIETIGTGDRVYCASTVGPDGSFVPGHVIACPAGLAIGAFDPAAGDDTPGATNACPAPALVINEIDYDQPGTDRAEFLEIKNAGLGPAALGGVSLELVNGNGGAIYQSFTLPAVTLGAGDFFVVCANVATVANCDLDLTPDSNLIQNGAPDAARLLFSGTVLDAVSYEGTVPGAGEGAGAVADSGSAGEGFKGISRLPDGADSGDNSGDFAFVCITPGAANTDRTTGCSPAGPLFEIFEIQGAGTASPFDGQTLTTEDNVVTALDTNGFFLQTPDERIDGDVQTSDGIFVFTGGAPSVAVGDRVDVTARVDEFFRFTELTTPVMVRVLSSGNPLPAPVVFDLSTPSPVPQATPDLERFEGMLVAFEGIATGPSDRFGDVTVVVGSERAFRAPGIVFPGLPGLPVWDGNPEIFDFDPDGLGGPDADVFAGQAVVAEGPLGFSFGDYSLLPTSFTLGPEPALPRPVRARAPGELTIASQNMLRLFDDVDDGIGEPVLTTVQFQAVLGKFSSHLRGVLDAPDVFAVQEVENLNVLEQLALRIAADGGPSYSSFLVPGNDIGGINVGFMTRDDRVQALSVRQFLADLTLSFDGSLLHDRPPLVLDALFIGNGAAFPFQVMVVHNRSLSGIDDPVRGPRVRQKRLEQAETIASLVQDLQTASPEVPLVVIGDFNAFQFTDGLVDPVGIIAGNPGVALLSGQDLVDPDLVDLVKALDPAEQYSFVFGGSAQVLDHALVSEAAVALVTDVLFARGNADAPDALMDDVTTPVRVSDHDALVLYLFADSDGDGVRDGADLCADTVIPEAAPTVRLLFFRYALTDSDTAFDTKVPPHWPFPVPRFTTEDTSGCSCEQIAEHLGLGFNQRRFGCGLLVMKFWVHHIAGE